MKRKPDDFLKSYLGYHYSVGLEEDAAVWPALQNTPAGQLMDSWGLTNLEAVKWTARSPQVKDRWQAALAVTPQENVAAMKLQLGELDTPAGRMAVSLLPHLRDSQLRTLWERTLRQKDTSNERNFMVLTLSQTGVDEQQSLPLVQLLWRDLERTSEQVPVALSFHSVARGEGLSFVLDRLIARPVMSDKLRAEFVALREEGGGWDKLRPLLEKLKREARDEDALRRMMGEKRDPSSGIKESGDSVDVGGIRLPKRKASPG